MKIINYFSVFSYLKPKYSQHSIQRKRQYKTVFFRQNVSFLYFALISTVSTRYKRWHFSLWCHHLVKNKFTGFEVLSSLVLMNGIFQMRSIRSIHEFLILEKSN